MSLLSPSLQAFLSVARLKTVQQAAKELALTQTGVTQRLRALETRLSTTLFTRSRKGMKLTDEGKALLHYCQGAVELEGETLAKLQEGGIQSHSHLSLCGPSSFVRTRIIPVCGNLADQFPKLHFSFEIDDGENRSTKLRDGSVDLAILSPKDVALEMDSKMLKPERYILVGAAKWQGRKLADIVHSESIIDFSSEDKNTQNYLAKFNLLEKSSSQRHFANNTDALAALVEKGVGYTVLTEEFAKPLLQRHQLIEFNKGKVMEERWALAWYPRAQMPSYFKSLIASVR